MQIITSKDNENIKSIKKLKEKKYREQKNCYIVEGIKIVTEAINEKSKIQKLVICEELLNKNSINKSFLSEIKNYACLYVSESVFKNISDVSNPQGVLAIIEKNNNKNNIDYNQDFIVILDDVQDPGNIGTILRTVDSVGITQIIMSSNCGDVYNPKVVRSTMGAIFRVKVIRTDSIVNTIEEIQNNKFKVIATDLNTNKDIYSIDYKKTAIVIGNEANGVSKEVLDKVDEKIMIPMLGKTESLNASVATGIILYEYVRQKLGK